MMAAKANPNSLFLSSSSSTHYSSFPFHQISLKKVSFLVDFQGRKLVFACSKKPIPGSVNLDPSISNSGSGSSKNDSDGASSSPSNAIDFLTLCHSLKTTKRKGWVNHAIKGAESIADHMYRMSLMALIVGDLPGVNRERCIKMAIVHDIAEEVSPKKRKEGMMSRHIVFSGICGKRQLHTPSKQKKRRKKKEKMKPSKVLWRKQIGECLRGFRKILYS